MTKTKLGRFNVDRKLLDEYVDLYITNNITDPSFAQLAMSGRLANIHKALRESMGLSDYWSANRDDAFDKALFELAYGELEKDSRYKEYRRVKLAEMEHEREVKDFVEQFKSKNKGA